MYEEFFGLTSSPFDLSPDPHFLFSSEKSREALASISYAVSRRKGFVVMTGEVGTGKTLILRCLFKLWESEQVPFAYFIGPKLSTMDFLKYIAFELGIEVTDPTKGNLLRALYGFFLAQFEKDLTTVLIIDEAHRLPQSVLEEVRLLANFETAQQKLLQILLVGQPELDKKLDSIELRSLKQRIAVRCQLEPLREEEIRNYIERRLERAGANSQAPAIFPSETIKAICRYSRGIPRLINSICDQSLIAAYEQQVRVVPVEIIDEIAVRFRLDPAPTISHTEEFFSPTNRIENSASDRPSEAIPTLDVATVGPPNSDAAIRRPDVGNGTRTTLPSGPETSVNASSQDNLALHEPSPHPPTIDTVSIREGLTDFDAEHLTEAKAVTLPPDVPVISSASVPVIAPGITRLLESARDSSGAGESIFMAPMATQSKAYEPAIHKKGSPTAGPGATFRSNQTLGAVRPFRLRRRLTPALRLSFLVSAAAVVAVALPAGVIMVRRQKAPVTTTYQLVAALETSPTVQAAPPVQAALASSPKPFDAAAVEPIGSRADSGTSKPAGELGHLVPHTKVIKGLSRPVLKLPRLSVAIEPPLITGVQTRELESKGLPDLSATVPASPGATGGHLQLPKLVSSPPPAYPTRAQMEKVEGTVVIDALVDEAGKVTDTKVISGPVSLTQAAVEALRNWKYEPERLNGQTVATHIKVSINFSLH